jgi:hypothetical protein
MKDSTTKVNDKMIEAEKRLNDYNKIIAPFIKKREIFYETTQGKWQTSGVKTKKKWHNGYL